jgi:nucleotide-binding universal stress UspA family protein
MRTILVAVDFSEPSETAARYALHLAKYMKANLLLCHAVYVPAEIPTEAFGSWPGYNLLALKDESIKSLEDVAHTLRNKEADFSMPGVFQPEITCLAECGSPTDVITHFAERKDISLVIMGMTGASLAERLLFGSNSRRMIDKTSLPLVLVPEGFIFNKINRIAFATNLNDNDIDSIHAISGLAYKFDADLLIAHICDRNAVDKNHKKELDSFLNDVTCKINYDKLYFREVDKSNIDKGLNFITEDGLIDLLVMVHRQTGLFASLFSSHTHALSNHSKIPLLIMPAGNITII